MTDSYRSIRTSVVFATLCLGSVVGCASTELGQEAEPPSEVAPSDETIAAYRQPSGNRLEAMLGAEKERRDEGFSAQANWVSGLWHAELGEYALAAAVYSPLGAGSLSRRPADGQCDDIRVPDAVEAFCARITQVGEDVMMRNEEAQPPQFVFIEDQPNLPAMRVFGQKILQCAQDAGFTHLAVEGLQEEGTAVAARGYVTQSSGLLTREPQLAGMIQQAVELGYELVSYDVPDRVLGNTYFTDVETYAEEQAATLLDKTYNQDSDIKVLVWTMPYQSRKQIWREEATRRTSVATIVFEQTGLEPYALEQKSTARGFSVTGVDGVSSSYLVSGLEESDCAWFYYPVRDNEILPSPLSGIVMHTPPENGAARWNWLDAPTDNRMSVTPSCTDCQRVLVQAFPAGSDTSVRVPTDQAVCASGSSCQMVMTPGEYELVLWGESGAQVGSETVTFEANGAVDLAL